MATVSFAGLDQDFSIADPLAAGFSAYGGTLYDYTTTGGHLWSLRGKALTETGGLLDGGLVKRAALDLNGDLSTPEIYITGFIVDASAFAVGVGTEDQQRDSLWAALLGGDDIFDFTLADYSVSLVFNGDGAFVADGLLHVGGADQFNDSGTALSGFSFLAGDWSDVISGVAVGGDDVFTVGAFALQGDFATIGAGASGIGGDDVIAPARVTDFAPGYFVAEGDAEYVYGGLSGGNDLIDLRAGTFFYYAAANLLAGDVYYVGPSGVVLGGDDTIHGSSVGDAIYGDWAYNAGYGEGGKDALYGYFGNDSIYGNDGRDTLDGADGDDVLDGGADGDVISGGDGDDFVFGDSGNDRITGFNGVDRIDAGSGHDFVDGGLGDDTIDGGAGADTLYGGAGGKDFVSGGVGDDWISGDASNDILSGDGGYDTLVGGNGFDALSGGADDDFLYGGAANDALTGGAGNDTFYYARTGAADTIFDFAAGVGVGDVVEIFGYGTKVDSFAEVLARATDNGADTTINFGRGDVLILKDVLVSQLASDDFVFG